MITFETEEDFERVVMKAIENRLQLFFEHSKWYEGDYIKIELKSTDGIVFRSVSVDL